MLKLLKKEMQRQPIRYQKHNKVIVGNTIFKMTVDYFATLDKVNQDELIAERQKAREVIRVNS